MQSQKFRHSRRESTPIKGFLVVIPNFGIDMELQNRIFSDFPLPSRIVSWTINLTSAYQPFSLIISIIKLIEVFNAS